MGQFAEVKDGSFQRQPNRFTDRITSDGSSDYPVEAGRYVLYVCLACPWAHRAIIVRRLLGLEDAIALRVVDPVRDEKGWRFTLDEGGVDPVTGASYVMELYRRSDPDFDGRATVPFLWDTKTERIVTNDYPQITLDLSTQWTALHAEGAPDLYPERAREAIDDMAEQNFHAINNGVYKAGFATTQEAYEQAYDALFAQLHKLEGHLSTERYLVGPAAVGGRRPAVHDARALRRRLPRPLQVQRAQADRAAEPVGLRPRPVPDARLRRHDRLRPHQDALLRHPRHDQPDRRRAEGAGPVGLGRAARPRPPGRLLRARPADPQIVPDPRSATGRG